jgi:hypothetical protein
MIPRTLSLFSLGLALAISSLSAAANPVQVREPGSVLMIAGQAREEFRDYLIDVTGNGRLAPRPAGAALYTNLLLTGLRTPHANEPGDHHQDMEYLRLVQNPLVMQVALWLSREQLHQVADGQFPHAITALRRELSSLKRPVFLRIGYEFDGPHNRYPPEVFIKAYRIIASEMRQDPDIILVWHSFALSPTYQESPFTAWWPGDDLVDWVAISFFQVGTEGYYRGHTREEVIAFAREKGLPVMIAESSPIRYTRRQKTLSGQAWWDFFFNPLFDLIDRNPEVRALSIIHVNWDSQRQHNFLDWGDSRLDRDPVILRNWRREASSPRFTPVDDNLYDAVRAMTPRLAAPAPTPASSSSP